MKTKIPVILIFALACSAVWIQKEARGGPEPPLQRTLSSMEPISPVGGPEFGLDEPVWSASVAGRQSAPALAWGNDGYLLVWQETRFDPVTWLPTTGIYGARVTAGGQVLDPVGILISPASQSRGGSPGLPAIAWDGQNYLVVWQESGGTAIDAIYGARVNPGGQVLDPDGILIAEGPLMEREPPEPCNMPCPTPVKRPALAWNGHNYLAVWVHVYPDSATIAGARVSAEGVVLDADPISISTGENRGHPAVAPSGDNYLVVWEQSWGTVSGYGPVLMHSTAGSWDIYGARVDSAGVVLDPTGIPISMTDGANTAPAVSSDGQNCLVVWSTKDTSWEALWLYGVRVDPEGEVLEPAPIAIGEYHWVFDPAVAWNGENYLVVWNSDWDHGPFYVWSLARGARVSPAGQVLDPEAIVISPGRDFAALTAVASNGQDWFVAWSGFGPIYRQPNTIHGARVSAAGVVDEGDITAITTRKNNERAPAIGFNGENYLVVWIDDRPGLGQVYGVRVRPDGQVLDATAIPISDINLGLGCSRVAVSSDGQDYFVVWQASDYWPHFGFIYGARVSAAGHVLDPEGIQILQGPGSYGDDSHVTIARGASNYLVVYSYYGWLISGTRVSFDGQVLERNAEHRFDWENAFEVGEGIPSVASVGADFLVIGRRPCYLEECASISATRVTADGQVLPAVLISDSSAGPAVLASDGENYLVAWSRTREPAVYDLQVARLAPTGELLSAVTVVDTGATLQESQALAWDGRNYVLAWNTGLDTSRQTYGLLLSQQGEPVDPGKFAFGSHLDELTLGSGPLAESLAAYSIFDADLGVSRVKARILLNHEVIPPPTDTVPPVMVCPPDVTVRSLNAVPPPVFTGTVSDNSDPDPVVAHVSDTAAGSRPIQITRVYQARDLAGNVAACAQIITVDLLPGDVTGDGVVDHKDLTFLLKQIHAHFDNPAYDVNGDGKLDMADAHFISRHFTRPGKGGGAQR